MNNKLRIILLIFMAIFLQTTANSQQSVTTLDKIIDDTIVELKNQGYMEDALRISSLKESGRISIVIKDAYNYDRSVEVDRIDKSGKTANLVIYSDFEKEPLEKRVLMLRTAKTIGDMVSEVSDYLKTAGLQTEAESISELYSSGKILEKNYFDKLIIDNIGGESFARTITNIRVDPDLMKLPPDVQSIVLLHERFRLNQVGYFNNIYQSEQDVHNYTWNNSLILFGKEPIIKLMMNSGFNRDGTIKTSADTYRLCYFLDLVDCATNWGSPFTTEKISAESDVTWYDISLIYKKLNAAFVLYTKDKTADNLTAYQQLFDEYFKVAKSVQSTSIPSAQIEAAEIINCIKQDVSSSFRLISITTHDQYSVSFEFERGVEPNIEKMEYFWYKPKGAKYATLTRKFGSNEELLSRNISKFNMDYNSTGNLAISITVTKNKPDGTVESSTSLSEEIITNNSSNASRITENSTKTKLKRIRNSAAPMVKKPSAVAKPKGSGDLKKLQEQMGIAYRKYTSLVSAGKSDSAEAKKALDEYRKLQAEIKQMAK